MNIIDPFSLVAVPIFTGIDNIGLSHGTCFFYEKKGDTYLVTNWHNLSGRKPFSGQPTSDTGAIPNKITLQFHINDQLGSWSESYMFPLYSDEQKPLWLQHSKYGQDVDIAVFKIIIPQDFTVHPINEINTSEHMRIEIGMDVFVLGFPIRLFTGIFPAWKRGTIATEPAFSVDEMPKFLIDTATQQGMSGAPVILRARGPYLDLEGQMKISTPPATKFLGIYSGRYTSDKLDEVQLGIVWRKELIDEIINDGVPGHFELR